MKTGIVKEFRDDYFFLSNFYPRPFRYAGREFKTGEHAFSYSKTYYHNGPGIPPTDGIMAAPTPAKAKAIGRRLSIDVEKWDANKIGHMMQIIQGRFADEEMTQRLLDTGAQMLVEGNTWGDRFWGRCDGKGLNVLGVLLMEERGRLRWS